MNVYGQYSDFKDGKHIAPWRKLGDSGSLIIDNGEYALKISYDEEYTGGFSIVPVSQEYLDRLIREGKS